MARCAYFYDKVTQKIIGMNLHHTKDPESPSRLKPVDCDLSEYWEDIRTGKKWPDILAAVTDQNPDNLEVIYAENIQTGHNEFKPQFFGNTLKLERRPYFSLNVLPNLKILSVEETPRSSLYKVNTEGGVMLDMQVQVKATQENQRNLRDATLKNIECELRVECTQGRLIPRDGKLLMKGDQAVFQWYLPDNTSKDPARCYVKDPRGEILISKSLQVYCF